MIRRIPTLQYNPLLPSNGQIPWYDPSTDTTYRINANDFLTGLYDPSDAWNELYTYADGDLVTFGLQVWISTEDDNIGNQPGPDSDFWVLDDNPGPVGGGDYWPLAGDATLTDSVNIDLNTNELTISDIVSNEYSSLNIGSGSVNLGVGDQTTLANSSFNLATESLSFSANDGTMTDGIVLRLDAALGAYLYDPSGNGIELYSFSEVSPNGGSVLTVQPAFSQLSSDSPLGDACSVVLEMNANSGQVTLLADSSVTDPYSFSINYLNGFEFRQFGFNEIVTMHEAYGIAVHDPANGYLLQSPDLNWWKLQVSDLGVISALSVGPTLP